MQAAAIQAKFLYYSNIFTLKEKNGDLCVKFILFKAYFRWRMVHHNIFIMYDSEININSTRLNFGPIIMVY